MAPSNQHIPTQLRQLIYYNLDCNSLSNALFLAGRLQAYEPKAPEAAYLLALCHLRLGQARAAYDQSKSYGTRGTHLGCSYVLAQACLSLEKHHEGLMAVERSRGLWTARSGWNKHTESRRQHLPDAAAVLSLQGKLCQAYGDVNKAVESYAEALKLNPFMWDAFTGLCDLGANVRIPNIFKMTPEMISSLSSSSSEDSSSSDFISSHHLPQISSGNDPFGISTTRANNDGRSGYGKSALFEKLNGSSTNLVTPMGNGSQDHNASETPTGAAQPAGKLREQHATVVEISTITEPPHAPMRKVRAVAGLNMAFGVDAPPRMKASQPSDFASRSRGEPDGQDLPSLSSVLAAGITDRKRNVSGHVAQSMAAGSTSTLDPNAPQPRKSMRLFNQMRPQSSKFAASAASLGAKDGREGREIRKVRATGAKGRSAQSTVGRVVSGNRKHGDPIDLDSKDSRPTHLGGTTGNPLFPVKTGAAERSREYESLQWLLDLFSKLGGGYFALSHYQCQDALQIFGSISSSQRETPWVLAQIGRSYYEQANHAEAAKYYARIKSMVPSSLEDMEVYSTVLWHLKSEIDLAFVAHEIIDVDRNSPQAWCAVGNSFSLQRDHDQALKCFRRATQLDPKFAYAFTLQGHEHVANEEYDKALVAFRSAIAVENRHYNAWYGLGKVFEKQGKYDVAEKHYINAAKINPTNAVLVCCIGVVLEKMKKPHEALRKYTESCELAPRSALSRFKKARVLMGLHRPDQALAELKVLKDIAPDEANVHFLLGRVYKILRQKGNAIKHFTTALNLDPKASHHIKEAMEQMEDDDDEEDDEQ